MPTKEPQPLPRAKEQDRHHRCQRGPQPSRWNNPTLHPAQHSSQTHPSQRDHGQRCLQPTMQWGLHHHPAACKCQQKGNSLTPCQGWYQSWRQCVTPLCVLRPIPRSDQSSWPTHWPRPHQYQAHCIQWIPYTPIWCTPRTHHLATKLPWLLPPQGKIILVCCGHPWSCHPGSTLKWKLAVVKMNCAITVRQPSTHPAPVSTSSSPWSSQAHQVHWWLDQGISRSISRHWLIPWWIQNPTPSWCTSCDTCSQKMPHCLMSKGQRAPQQDGMPRCDHLCRQTNGLGILYHLCPEGQWQATSVPGSLWPHRGHLPWSSQDANHGRSCSWVCTLPLLH